MMPLLLAALALRVLIPDVMSGQDMSGMSVAVVHVLHCSWPQ